MGPQNGVIGDSYGTDLPQTRLAERDLAAEKNAAKFSKSKEFQALKVYLEGRIEFYQTYLPDGRALTDAPEFDRGSMWVVANAIVGEFKAVLNTYETAQEAVRENARRRDT